MRSRTYPSIWVKPTQKSVVAPTKKPYVIPRVWPGSTVVCIASGPSLTQEDVDYVRGKAKVIVVNSSYQMAPWADLLYACDARWWKWNRGATSFTGLKFALTKESGKWPGVRVLEKTGVEGLETKKSALRTGGNSGYQVINLAVHMGASRIVLLGYDMQRGPKGEEHWHPDYPNRSRSPYNMFVRHYGTLVDPLREIGVDVINCTRRTAIQCFPRQSLVSVFEPAGIETAPMVEEAMA